MLFLMNDAVLDVDMRELLPPPQGARFRTLTLPFVLELGREMFAETPLLHQTQPEQARRLAALILCTAPKVNAALFQAPEAGCAPADVASHLAEVSPDVIGGLRERQQRETLTPAAVDRQVWRRMAA
jgi:hypothetical protein